MIRIKISQQQHSLHLYLSIRTLYLNHCLIIIVSFFNEILTMLFTAATVILEMFMADWRKNWTAELCSLQTAKKPLKQRQDPHCLWNLHLLLIQIHVNFDPYQDYKSLAGNHILFPTITYKQEQLLKTSSGHVQCTVQRKRQWCL